MKHKTFLAILLLITLLFGVTTTIGTEDHGGDEHHVANHCDTPTKKLHVNATESLSYDKDEYFVDKNTCYEIVFYNPNPNQAHDLQIDATEVGDHHFDMVHLHVANNTDGHHGVKTMNMQTPNADTELTIYCTIEGHQLSGMEATLVVGEGLSSSVPFNSFYAFLGLAFLVIAVPLRSRYLKNI